MLTCLENLSSAGNPLEQASVVWLRQLQWSLPCTCREKADTASLASFTPYMPPTSRHLLVSSPTNVVLHAVLVLQVASEDTVLYTVQRYMDSHCRARRNKLSGDNYDDDGFEGYSREHIQKRLGPLLRCQHLSQYWLLLSAMSYGSYSMPLFQLERELKQLLTLRTLNPSATSAEMKGVVEYAPPSWFLGERSISSVSTVQLTWELDVSTLRETAQRSAAEQEQWTLSSPSTTAPLGGIAFGIMAICEPQDSNKVVIGLFAAACGVPADATVSFVCKLSAPPAGPFWAKATPQPGLHTYGFVDYFDVGPMAGGWDEVAWASKGLPASGPLVIKLSVSKAGHMANTVR